MNSPHESFSLEHLYPSIDTTRAGESIRQLHEQVCASGRRVEITRPDCDDRCVIISKNELNQLEETIAILAGTQDFQQMCASIHQLLAAADMVYPPRS